MVNLEFQKFWEPSPAMRNTRECARGTGNQSPSTSQGVAIAAQVNNHETVYQSEDSGLGLEGTTQLETGDWACQPDEPTDYPEDVALYATSRSNGTPSVTGLDGPGTGRVFDVFGDDDDGNENDRNNDTDRVLRPRKRSADSSTHQSPKRRRRNHPTSTGTPPQKASHPKLVAPSDGMDILQNSVRYIQRLYSMIKDNNGPVESLGQDDPVRHDLAVLQQAMSKLQHAYGVIATQTTATDLLKLKPSTVRPRQESKRGKWAVEDDKRLLELRGCQGLPWGHIFELFPGRTPGAIQLRYYTMSRKENGTPSTEKRHKSRKSSANRRNRPSRPVIERSTRARPHNIVGNNLDNGCSSESAGTENIAVPLSQGLENVDPRILDSDDRMW